MKETHTHITKAARSPETSRSSIKLIVSSYTHFCRYIYIYASQFTIETFYIFICTFIPILNSHKKKTMKSTSENVSQHLLQNLSVRTLCIVTQSRGKNDRFQELQLPPVRLKQAWKRAAPSPRLVTSPHKPVKSFKLVHSSQIRRNRSNLKSPLKTGPTPVKSP